MLSMRACLERRRWGMQTLDLKSLLCFYYLCHQNSQQKGASSVDCMHQIKSLHAGVECRCESDSTCIVDLPIVEA